MLCVRNFSNVSLKGIWWVVLKQPIKKLFKQWSVEMVRAYMCIWIYFVNWYLFFIYYRNRHIVLLYMYKQVINRFRFKCLQFSTFSRFFLLLWKSSVIVLVVWVQIKVYAVIYRSFRIPLRLQATDLSYFYFTYPFFATNQYNPIRYLYRYFLVLNVQLIQVRLSMSGFYFIIL